MIALAWVIFAVIILAVVGFCYLIIRHYQDKHESEPLPTWVAVIGLALTLLCVFLIPVDIYSVSSITPNHSTGERVLTPGEIEQRGDAIRIIYYVLYAGVLAFAFGLIPFSYFYYEEEDEQVTIKQKIWAGCKYTIFLLLIVAILLGIGLIIFFAGKPGNKPTKNENTEQWVKTLLKRENVVEASISFAIASLTVLGYVIWIVYTAYGLSALPIGIIKGRKNVTEDMANIQNNLDSTKEKQRAIKSKYLAGGKKMSKKDEEQLGLLLRKEKILSRQGERLSKLEGGCLGKILVVIKPFLFLFGFLFIAISALILTSIVLTDIDRAVNSSNFCGAKCGFVLAYPKIFNPLDTLFTILARYFPLDYVLVGALILYIFLATLSGVIKIGIRFLWIKLYSIRKHSSPPQGLLLATIILMLAVLALNMELTTLSPQYASFGSQVFLNTTSGKVQACSLEAPPGECTMTQIGSFITRISLRTNFFAMIYYYMSWGFIAAALIGFVVVLIRGRSSNIERRDDDSDSDED